MNATRLLIDQHKEVMDLFEEYREAEDAIEKRALFVKVADALSAHATIEEKLFYPAVYVGEMKDLLEEAVQEHLEAKRIIADLLDAEWSVEFDARMKELEEAIREHKTEEEDELFPKVRKNFTRAELETLGNEMEAMFDELIEGEPRKQVPEEIAEPAPLE
jgi:hypothetical protein